MIDLSPDHLKTVRRILAEQAPGCEVRAFGSRVTWTAKDFSDLDLAIVGAAALDWGTLGRLREAFEESDLPIQVDVLDWHSISLSFQEVIERDYEVLQEMSGGQGRRVFWNLTTIGEFAPFMYGKGLPKRARNSAGSVPVFGSNGIVGYHDVALTCGPTVIIGRKGTAGAVHYSPVPCWPIDTTFYVTGDDFGRLRFVFYTLKTLDLADMNADSAVPGLNRTAAHGRELRVPEKSTQRAIAHILGTLDDKIELNRRMNETLEQMARALFKSWFVDFEPVRAKMEGRWRAGQSLPGLPAHLHDLFPSRLAPSELGEIPAGWEVTPLDGIADFLNGLAMQKYPAVDGKALPVIKIAQLRVGSTAGADLASADIPNQYAINDGDVLFSWSGSLELDTWTGGPGALNQHLFKVTSNKYPKWFFYQWITHHMPVFREIAAGKATTMGHIRRHHLSEAATLTPSHKLLREMNVQMEPLFQRGLAIRIESRALAAQRDALLPKLVSGKVRTGGQSGSLQMRLSVTRSKESRDRWK